jgi:hypothetical protein
MYAVIWSESYASMPFLAARVHTHTHTHTHTNTHTHTHTHTRQVHQYDIVMDVTVINRTAETLQVQTRSDYSLCFQACSVRCEIDWYQGFTSTDTDTESCCNALWPDPPPKINSRFVHLSRASIASFKFAPESTHTLTLIHMPQIYKHTRSITHLPNLTLIFALSVLIEPVLRIGHNGGSEASRAATKLYPGCWPDKGCARQH